MIKCGAIGDAKGVAKLATFGNNAGCQRASMGRKAAGPGKVFANVFNAGEIASGFFVDFKEVAINEKVGLKGWKTVAGTKDERKIVGTRGRRSGRVE